MCPYEVSLLIEYILNIFRHLQYINKDPKKSVFPNCHENIYVFFPIAYWTKSSPM